MKQGVVVVGSLSLDTNLTKERAIDKLGGAVTYGGLTFARLGIATAVVFNLAQSDRPVCRLFEAEGVKLFVGETGSTTRFTNDIRGEKRRQTAPVLAEPVRADSVRQALESGATHLHLGLLHWYDVETTFLEELPRSGLTVSADTQGLLRRPLQDREGGLAQEASPLLADVLRSASHIKASRREMACMNSHFGLDAAGILREFGLREIIITEDKTGGVVIGADGKETRYHARTDEGDVLDTTGAGDVFFAAYLAHRLHRDENVAIASGRAAEIASRHVRGRFIAEASLALDRYLAIP